jgi:hypothetical protein
MAAFSKRTIVFLLHIKLHERRINLDLHGKLDPVRCGLVVQVDQLDVVALGGEEDQLVAATEIWNRRYF